MNAEITTQATSIWQLLIENALGLTVVMIFMCAAIGAITRRRKKDKCLKLFHDHHVTLLTKKGMALWGDLGVYSQGLELHFDSLHKNRRGIEKGSALIYSHDVKNLFGLCRVDGALTEKEKQQRVVQVKRTFQPGILRRFRRSVVNLVNTFRDAFTQAFNAILAAVAKSKPGGVAGTKQSKEIGQTLIGSSNAYEPLLES